MWNLLLIYSGLLGLIIGSFLNALIWRLHSGESMFDRSRCPKCHHVLAWHDNIPLFSFLFLRGKCRHCGVAISWQYLVVEFVTSVLFVLIFLNHESRVMSQDALFIILDSKFLILLFRDWFIVSIMIIVFVYDLRWYLILDKVLVPAGVILFGLWLIENYLIGNLLKIENWKLIIMSFAIGFGFFALQYYISNGKWIGGGDVKLGIVMGLALPQPSHIVGAIFLAYILGSIFGLILIGFGKKELGSKLPFGTFLSVATVVIMLWGEGLINWYFKLLGF